MTAIDSSAPTDLGAWASWRKAAPILLCLAVLAFAPIRAMIWGTTTDVSWIITLCERVLAGDRLYVDIFETNPPMTVWMYLPAVVAARWMNLAPEVLVQAYCYLASIFGLGFAGYIAHRAKFPENGLLYRLLPVFLAILTVLPANSFAQREQFGVALLLPLLTLMAWRARLDSPSRPGVGLAIAAGLSGSLIVLVKPYYAVIILVPALYVAWRRGSLRSLFAVEYWTVGLVCLAYLAAVMVFHPEYVRDVYPILADTYLQIRGLRHTLLTYGALFLPILIYVFGVRRGAPTPPLMAILILTAIAAMAPLVYQGKSWPYHALPVFMLGLGALAWRVFQPGKRSLLAIVAPAPIVLAATLPFTHHAPIGEAMIETIGQSAPNPTVGVIAPGIGVGHPFNRMVNGVWSDLYCSDWLGDAALYLAQRALAAGDQAKAAHYEAFGQAYIDGKAARLRAAPPRILVTEAGDSAWVKRVIGDPAFAGFMDQYRLIAEDDVRKVYQRN